MKRDIRKLSERHFGQDELREILLFLELQSKKDAAFDPIKVLNGSQWFTLLQDGENKKALINDLIDYINVNSSPHVAVAITLLREAVKDEIAKDREYLDRINGRLEGWHNVFIDLATQVGDNTSKIEGITEGVKQSISSLQGTVEDGEDAVTLASLLDAINEKVYPTTAVVTVIVTANNSANVTVTMTEKEDEESSEE